MPDQATGTAKTASQAPAALGVVEWFPYQDRRRVLRALAELEQLGIGRLRTGISWADWHRSEGESWIRWLWSALGAAELELLPNCLYTPPSLGRAPSTSSAPRDPRDYARFLDAMIQLFGEHFEQVELWNEPNNWAEWDRALDPYWRLFAEMVMEAAEVARANGKLVVLGGLSPIDPGFLVRMREERVLDAVDVVGVHGFPGTWEASWRGWEAELERARQATSKPIWITETGCARTGRVDRQVSALRSALGGNVERVYWYSLFDLERTRRSLREINLGVHDRISTGWGWARDSGVSSSPQLTGWRSRAPDQAAGAPRRGNAGAVREAA